jgi:hypothetical protein
VFAALGGFGRVIRMLQESGLASMPIDQRTWRFSDAWMHF